MAKFAALIFTAFVSGLAEISEKNYYWREYTGKIPNDAVVAGQDINGNNVHIGQAYLKNKGLIVGQINPGVKHVYVEFYVPNRVDEYIKILCGPMENFVWIRTNSSRLHLDLLNKHAVIGGHDDGFGTINIGRIFYEGGTQVGKITSYRLENSAFYCVDRNSKQRSTQSYEVLVYERKTPI